MRARFTLLKFERIDGNGVQVTWNTTVEIEGKDKPALVAFSDSDPVFPFPRAGEAFTSLIPTSGEQVKIEGAAHFLQEDRGTAIVDAMQEAFGRPAATAA